MTGSRWPVKIGMALKASESSSPKPAIYILNHYKLPESLTASGKTAAITSRARWMI